MRKTKKAKRNKAKSHQFETGVLKQDTDKQYASRYYKLKNKN